MYDLVVNTGDNLGHPKAIGTLLTALGPLGKTRGVFVNGSNDMFAPAIRNPFSYLFKPSNQHKKTHKTVDVDALNKGLSEFGWENLNNRAEVLQIKNSTLGFIGTNDAHEGKADFGFNARTEIYENLLKAGVIDPTKVTRVALENAASIASMLLTTECVIADKPKAEVAAPAAPDMGGMGY